MVSGEVSLGWLVRYHCQDVGPNLINSGGVGGVFLRQ